VDVAGFAASGGVAACVSHSLSVPLDVIKTRLQVEKFEDERVLSVARDIAARDGVLALASGWESTFLGYAVQGSLKYGGFESLKSVAFGDGAPWASSDHRLVTLLACASCAEVVGSAFLAPLEQIRIKTVSDDAYGADFFSAARRFAEEDGLASVAENLPVIYAKMIPYTAVQLASYDALTTSLGPYFSDEAVLVKRLLSAVLAGVMASLASQPGDTLLSVRNKGKSKNNEVDDGSLVSPTTDEETINTGGTGIAVISPPRNGKETVLEAAARLGPFGLMTGWRARILHVTSIVVVQLLVYDYMKSILAN
jgi:solute carrier family 25 phosphate transporter 3